MYDVTDETSFANIRNWMRNIEQHATDNVNKMLIGNKCDMVDKKKVDSSRASALADEYEIKFLETSAKNNINVEQAFYTIARDIKRRLMDSQEKQIKGTNPNLRLQAGNGKEGGKKGGCCS